MTVDPMEWRAGAACRDADPRLFFAEPESGRHLAWVAEHVAALELCATCPVRAACREWAVENYEQGVWGGTTDTERAAIRADRELPPRASKPITHGTVTGYNRGCRLDCCRHAHALAGRARRTRRMAS